ncbi:Enolase-phosphatase E1 [Golovinomyces cichoracearum]|uniref:Enolase-phosphatase E1 n=1 Tax=Golovinomyces cichoracearum TaxID=62708 RepID=A0A420J069_9PEZI|nr:Enolase-phosphatase E1 [Golovinomyces cichoracearum]
MALQIEGVKAVLLDIEGTVCHLSFVKDVLFPYALKILETRLESLWTTPSFLPYLNAFPATVRTQPDAFLDHIRNLMAKDIKDACLKNLQGYLWQDGYENGVLRCPLFSDVASTMRKWNSAGLPILIYSSGSVAAQKLLFQYTEDGDLRPFLSGYFDTQNAGPKTESSSYINLVAQSTVGVMDPRNWLFFSDRVSEVDAAKAAGMKALVILREGNVPLDSSEKARCQSIDSLAEVEIL